jgi:hypothetical protein
MILGHPLCPPLGELRIFWKSPTEPNVSFLTADNGSFCLPRPFPRHCTRLSQGFPFAIPLIRGMFSGCGPQRVREPLPRTRAWLQVPQCDLSLVPRPDPQERTSQLPTPVREETAAEDRCSSPGSASSLLFLAPARRWDLNSGTAGLAAPAGPGSSREPQAPGRT